ncbi:Fe(2+)-trafficking protein, partial [Candidatus Desantisbacteria bacterium]|nr:Fe(2+)-trafficking protein [Candidatus Desantisbacteria bacterium]
KKVFENVSKQAWMEFLEFFKMVVNSINIKKNP